jgi:hypothetical protein
MSVEASTAGRAAALPELEAEARYARERYQLYRARAYGSRMTSQGRLRELERMANLAQGRLDRAKATDRSTVLGGLVGEVSVR